MAARERRMDSLRYVPQQQVLLQEARVRGVSLHWWDNEGIAASQTTAHQNLTVRNSSEVRWPSHHLNDDTTLALYPPISFWSGCSSQNREDLA